MLHVPSQKPQVMTNYGLAFVVLLMALTPPAYHHAHACGDASHSHVHADCRAQHHHPHGNRHDHPSATPSQAESRHSVVASEAVPHVHLSFLFVHVTWPCPSEGNPSQHDEHVGDLPCVLAQMPQAPLHRLAGKWTGGDLMVAPLFRAPSRDVPAPLLTSATLPDAIAYLCDTARHERSGAQLF